MTPRRNLTLTLGQAAGLLGVSPGTLRNQAIRGKLRAIRPGHDWLVTEDEIERYRREHLGRRQPTKAEDERRQPQITHRPQQASGAYGDPERGPTFGSPRPAPKTGKR